MYYWYTLLWYPTNFLYGQCALLLAVYNVLIWHVEEVQWFILPNHGIWWNKKYKINWRKSQGTSRKRQKYCPRFYSRSCKRGSRVCNKTAKFTATSKTGSRKTSSQKPGVFTSSGLFTRSFSRQKTRIQALSVLRRPVSDGGKHPNYVYPLLCASTSTENGYINGVKADIQPSCMPCATEYDSDSTWVGIDSLSTYCITNDVNDYTEPPSAIRREVKGIQQDPALITIKGKGKFRIVEQGGATVELLVDQLYYCNSAPVKIL